MQSSTGKRLKLGFESHITTSSSYFCASARVNNLCITYCFWSKLQKLLRIFIYEDPAQLNGVDILQKMWSIRNILFVVNTVVIKEKDKARSTDSAGT